MLGRDRGLVLRVFPLRETSAIACILGREHGRLRLVARGVRAPRSRAGASLEPGNEIDFVFTLQPGRDLGNMREATLVHPWVAGLGRLEPMAVAWAALEMLERILPEGAPEEGLLDDVWGFFEALRRDSDRAGVVLLFYAFELRLLERLGHAPELGSCRACGGVSDGAGALDADEGTWVCARCRPPGPRLVTVPTSDRDLVLALMAAPWEAAGLPTHVETRRRIGRLLHLLLSKHVERYRYPRALGLLKKVDGEEDTSVPNAEVD